MIHNAGDLSLAGLARAIADIAARARSGDLKPDELSGGTFTITNIGSQGALFDTPILVRRRRRCWAPARSSSVRG